MAGIGKRYFMIGAGRSLPVRSSAQSNQTLSPTERRMDRRTGVSAPAHAYRRTHTAARARIHDLIDFVVIRTCVFIRLFSAYLINVYGCTRAQLTHFSMVRVYVEYLSAYFLTSQVPVIC